MSIAKLIHKYDLIELEFNGPAQGNPFRDVWLKGRCVQGDRQTVVSGFYDGDGVYRLRFMPDSEGEWQVTTESNAPALEGIRYSFTCLPAQPGVHGPVRVRDTFHFAFDDGTPYYPAGTTCYAWIHQPEALQDRTIETLRGAPFNKLRMTIFPKHYIYNRDEPILYPFARTAEGENDYTRPNPAFYRMLEQRIVQLASLGIEVDLILFHPYDRWGYARMDHADDLHYLRYVVARLAAYRNVWWSLANEYDFMLSYKTVGHWDEFFQTIQACDPYNHLRSIHNGNLDANYDHTKPWVTHVCIQNPFVHECKDWRRTYGKPVIDDECEYEGNIPMPWGNISAQELVHRFWVLAANGCYGGHGETYVHPEDELWWSKGGTLRGESWPRIALLREILETSPGPLTPLEKEWTWGRVSGGACGDYRLLYFGPHQPVAWGFGLPRDVTYQIEWIDTWRMTVTSVRGTFHNATEIPLPGKPWMAVRIRPAR